MIRPVNELDCYRYSISEILLNANDFEEAIVIKPIQVNSLVVYKDFKNNVIPSLMLTANVDKNYYEKVITSMNTLTATFKIYKAKDEDEINNDKVIYNHPIIEGTFKAVNRDLIDTRAIHQLDAISNDATNSTQSTVELNLYLYDYESHKKLKQNHSYILRCSMNDCLYIMLKDRNFNNILMTSVYTNENDFIIQYGSLKENLEALNDYYGIYDNPYLFFADFDTTYLIDSGDLGKTLRDDELGNVNMYLEKVEESNSIYSGCYVDIENGNYILNASPFSINDSDSMIDFYSAGRLISVINGSKEKYDTLIGDYDIERAVRINNKKLHTQSLYNINTSKRSIPIEFTDIDVTIITPNKKYTLIPDQYYNDKYYIKGEYVLNTAIYVFARKTEDIMKCTVQCTFNKINDR